MTNGPKRITALAAQTAAGYSDAISVSDYDAITISFSAAASSNQVVKIQGGIGTVSDSPLEAPDFTSAAAVGNEWAYKEIINQIDSTDVVIGSTGITFSAAGVSEYTLNTERLDWISIQVVSGSAGAVTARLLCYKS
jgi:hypothetical protein